MTSISTRTFTETTGSGANKITKTIVEKTITKKDGSKTVTREESTTHGDSKPTDMGSRKMIDDRGHETQGAFFKTPKKSEEKAQTVRECIDDALKAHNTYRKKHGVPPLKHAQDLSDYAQKWADHLISTHSMGHSNCTLPNGDRLGENIAYFQSSGGVDYTGQQAVDSWYDEIKKHDFNSDRMIRGTGHFTQVVWKGSKELGIGKSVKDGKIIIVGSYRPAGNMQGDFRENVFPPK